MTMRILKICGTGESPTGRNMLSPIRGESVVYRPEIAPIGLQTYRESVMDGVHGVARRDDGDPYIIAAYSLGCCVALEALRLGVAGGCRGLVLVANPLRMPATPGGTYGIAGSVPIRLPHTNVWIHDDPITSLPASDGCRSLAVKVTGRAQLPHPGWLNAGAVVASLWRYLVTGRHTAYGIEHRPDGRTHMEYARDEAYRMAGVTA